MNKELNPVVESMSVKEMERITYDILTDNGMSEDEAENTIKSMSLKDLERYISDAQDAVDEFNEDDA